jgi:hypothetical protein
MLGVALLLAACSDGQLRSGLQASWSIQTQPINHDPQPAGPKQWITTEGLEITLTAGWVVPSRADLAQSCDQPGFVAADWPAWLGLGSAQAHIPASPTRLGTPTVVDLLAADSEALDLGAINPLPDSYCGSDWGIFAADEDAVGLDQTPQMLGLSVLLQGRYGPEQKAFELRSSRSLSPVQRRFPSLETLDTAGEQLHLRLNLAYDTWFDGVDMAALARGEDNAVVQVLQAISNTASVALNRPDQN